MAEPDLSGYTGWLETEGYQPSTIEATLRNLAAATRDTKPHHKPHIRRYMRYVTETGDNPLRVKLVRMSLDSFEPSARRRRHGSRTKQLLGRAEWKLLKSRLRPEKDVVSQVLLAYMGSELRIGDFLSVELTKLDDVVADKRARDWCVDCAKGLRKTGKPSKTVADLLCMSERCAYVRLRKRLQAVSTDLGYEADLDTVYKSRQKLGEDKNDFQ